MLMQKYTQDWYASVFINKINNIISERKREMHKKNKTYILKTKNDVIAQKKLSMFDNFTHK